MAYYRIDGQEQPHIKMGIFKLRIPFVHFKPEIPELLQGFLLIAIPMSSITAHRRCWAFLLNLPLSWSP